MEAKKSAFGRWRRLVAIAVAIVVCLAVFFVLPSVVRPWYQQHVTRAVERRTIDAFLRGVRVTFLLATLTLPVVLAVAVMRLRWLRLRGRRGLWSARVALLSTTLLFLFVAIEGFARWRLSPSGQVAFAHRFACDEEQALDLVVIGESSAQGWPYSSRFSVGEVVGWQLERVLPGRRVHVDSRAVPGFRLGQAVGRLRYARCKPDALLIYAGQNEFQARFAWARTPPYYADDPGIGLSNVLSHASRHSAAIRQLNAAIDANRVDEPFGDMVPRELIDRPCCTTDEHAAIRDEYERDLESIARYGDEIGAVVTVIVPPSDLGGVPPNRSYMSPTAIAAEREDFAKEFLAARQAEVSQTAEAAEAAYRRLVARQPMFAEAHFRLARALAAQGKFAEAELHDRHARDFDGMPVRTPGDLIDAARSVARRHPKLVLIDGPEVLRAVSPHGLVDDHLMHDPQHPTFRAYLALAQAVLTELGRRRALGWPEDVAVPRLDPAECAAHFDIDAQTWVMACTTSASICRLAASVRYDSQPLNFRAEENDRAAQRIAAGECPEAAGVAGIGIFPPGLRDLP